MVMLVVTTMTIFSLERLEVPRTIYSTTNRQGGKPVENLLCAKATAYYLPALWIVLSSSEIERGKMTSPRSFSCGRSKQGWKQGTLSFDSKPPAPHSSHLHSAPTSLSSECHLLLQRRGGMGVEGQPVTETNVQLGGKGRGRRKTGRRERWGESGKAEGR